MNFFFIRKCLFFKNKQIRGPGKIRFFQTANKWLKNLLIVDNYNKITFEGL